MRILSRSPLPLPLATFLLLVAVTRYPLEAQPMRFERLSFEDGLSQHTVNCILQDRRGFLWFGTQDGLNRYDGYEFQVYRHRPGERSSLPHDWIMALDQDPSGDLWIGTRGGGLARWRRADDSFVSYRHDPEDPTSLAGDRVVALHRDRAGSLWIGTLDSGLSRLAEDATFERFRHDPGDPASLAHDHVSVITEDGDGRLWVGTQGGLDLFDPASRSFVHFRHDPADPRSLSDDRVRAILEDRQGALWIGTHDGLNRFEPGPGLSSVKRFRHDPAEPGSLSHDWVRALHEDRDGRLWVGTDGGLNLWHEPSGDFLRYRSDPADPWSLGSDQVLDLYQDRGGILWLSVVGAGVNKWNPRSWSSFPHYGAGDGDAVFALSEDRAGVVWVGTFGGGLERVVRGSPNPERGPVDRRRYRHDPRDPESLADDRVTALLHDRQETLWVGTVAGGLHRFDAASERFERFMHDPDDPESLSENAISALYEDRRGGLWIGTYGGGLNLHRGDGTFTRFRHRPGDPTSLGSDRVFSLAEDRAGFLWMATDGGGLNRLHPATGAFLRLRHDPDRASSLATDELLVVYADPRGRLWVGTKGRGLASLERLDEATGSATFRHFTRASGLPGETIWAILSDERGALWLSTNGGLSRFDPETERFKNYVFRHGLQSNEFNQGAAFRSPSGELFFGGVNGWNAFFPERIKDNSYVPPVVVTSFTKINRPVDFERPIFDVDEIALDHRDYFFSLEVAALDFTAPEENRYRYKLEGFDADWVELGNRRRMTFTNLNAGRYTLRVQGSNSDGIWNEEGAAVRILIAPAPWNTVWARVLYLLAALGIAFGFVRHHHRKVARERSIATRERGQSQERQKLLDEREGLIEELEAKNAELERFNYTVSHDLKSPLVTIKGFLGLLEKDAVAGDLERLRHDVRRISAAADRMHRLLEELLELSRLGRQVRPPEEVKMVELAGEALELIGGQAAESGVEVAIDPALPVVFGDRLRLLQLYQNLLANAAKYMGDQPTPRIEVGIRREPEPVFFVRDNGIGIDQRYHEKVFGLFERLDAVNEGTGIGLALAKRIVEMHGGRIWVESEGTGSGSVFCFTLAPARVERGGKRPPRATNADWTREPGRRSSAGG